VESQVLPGAARHAVSVRFLSTFHLLSHGVITTPTLRAVKQHPPCRDLVAG